MEQLATTKPQITGFSASGILGSFRYHLTTDGGPSIIVGPNGTGKSTFLSLFYLFITQQWARLSEFEFTELTLFHTHGEISVGRIDVLSYEPPSTKFGSFSKVANRLFESGAFDLVYKSSLTKEEKQRFANAVSIPSDQVNSLRKYFQAELSFNRAIYQAERELQKVDVGHILYLPTYRRIEKDIKSIFPDIENRIRSRMDESALGTRTGAGFTEIAGFGMGDIKAMIAKYTSSVREFQRLASESASQEYIRDIVSGEIRKYSLTNVRRMSETDFEDFKNRLDDKLFSASDREEFRAKITALRQKAHGKPKAEDRYLGMFVEKLLAAHRKVKAQEGPLRQFVDTITDYISPAKRAVLDGHDFRIEANEKEEGDIPLEKLSSGEKQIVSIFAYLLLSGRKDFMVFIDEPELSLSVPWQKKFLPDLIETGACAHLFAVTHSPFVFDNHLRSRVVDVRRLRG